ncbi:unnamed protein product [Mycena citricolor]|uniref:CTLH domain-containing protein n=1 Tax=Mycena citricolor TaxID=2018698 RepID=A0AAD2GQ89_9AGAR|nr:unnamed protein product [Mycena citricolor]CAK5274693.1 unnamed protein product [Mycena citricolor]
MNAKNVEGMLLLEQSFARVPYENYRKVFRTSQRYIDRDLYRTLCDSAKSFADQASSSSAPTGGEVDSERAIQSIDAMITNVENLKRKLSQLHATSGGPTQDVLRERLQHVATIERPSTNEAEHERWADARLDRWLVDWALRNGKENTARMIAKEKHIENLVDIDLFSDVRRIEKALEQHSCAEALVWCSENKSALRKMKSTLEFDLRLQEFIELARALKYKEAIAYSHKYLVPWKETHAEQIMQVSALLCFQPKNTSQGRYKRLYDPSRWSSLVESFRRAVYSLNALPSEPLLNLSLYAGLASLKLPACFNPHTKNVDCPVCDGGSGSGGGLGKLAEQVPLSHHANSTIVCWITGKIMDADNMPLAFPDSGYVYSKDAMEEMALKNNGVVTCPRSKSTCQYSDLRKVFIS